jgi:hypothetical protein
MRSPLGIAKYSMSATITHKLNSPGKENVALTLELYRNGEPWGDEIPVGNPHFRFGKVKAQIILASWDIIEEYIETAGSKPALFDIHERYVSNTSFVNVKVVKQGEFINKAGILVEKHYLQFNYGNQFWGFGVTKAQALPSFQDMIQFVANS